MDSRIVQLSDVLRLNTRLFRNCLDGLTEEQARVRPSGTTNSAAFVAAHVADARFYLLRVLGAERPNPLARYLNGARSIDDLSQYPSLTEIQTAWTTASHALRDRLDAVTAAELDAPVTIGFPVANQTVLGVLTFLVQHDSYHVGQLALLRKYAGLPAMRYT
ncbi:MAG TPA: DinB family protein [Acidobacteriota bacterium]